MPKSQETQKEIKELWAAGQVPATFEPAIINQETGEAITVVEAIARTLNKVEAIEKVVKA